MQHPVVGKLRLSGDYVVFKEKIQQRQELCFKVIVSLIRAQVTTVKLFTQGHISITLFLFSVGYLSG